MSAPAVHRGDGSGREMKPSNVTTGELFPDIAPAADAPTMPEPNSRRAAILEALRRGEKLTHADALARAWGWRLAADVFALSHDHGWPIQADMIPQGEGRNPIAIYWLDAGAK